MDTIKKRKSADKHILLIFKISAITVLALSLLNLLIRGTIGFLTSLNVLFNGLTVSFFFAGLVSWYHYRKKKIINYRKLFYYLLIIFGVVSAVFVSAILLYYRGLDISIFGVQIAFKVWTVILGFVSSVMGLAIAYIFFLMMGFGVVGLLSAFLRKHTFRLLKDIKGLTKSASKEKGTSVGYIYEKLLGWLFNIPPYLDTDTLTVKEPEKEIDFPRENFKKAILWEIFFCVILALNISLNPILLEYFSLNELFGITSSVATLTPLIVLPWFVYSKLGVEIEGAAENFKLYEGMRNRILSLLVAMGTLITFIRLSVRRIDMWVFLYSFLGYLLSMFILTLLFTFVYFNHFWKDLIKDVYTEYKDG